MQLSHAAEFLAEKYPHCAELLKTFTPLLEAQRSLAGSLPPPVLPPLESNSFLQGKAWLRPETATLGVYLDEAFLDAAPGAVKQLAKAVPQRRKELAELGKFLKKERGDCRKLIALPLTGKAHRMPYWAKTRGLDKDAAALFGTQLARAAALRVAKAAAAHLLSWDKGWCPICGSMPHAACLKDKEGRRFLQCSLCGHEWRFSRTSCPVCGEERPEKLELFFFEGDPQARVEGCATCLRYLPVPDLRAAAEEIPLELLALCLMPLDLLVQEKGFSPAASEPRQ